ncbi:HNH endonuclease [Brevundimonas vesicularis]|uniref:HNH endonuclease n=1 Tax=Brevundimonas vesicularis TaxID=41276 RepID=UPI0012ECD850|nr:HNH endonuclease [Brevundimonas vesicularis]
MTHVQRNLGVQRPLALRMGGGAGGVTSRMSQPPKKPRARSYSPKTLKTLFALSGNRCAEPDCTERVIRPARDGADVQVVGEIAHIYASSDKGPRGKPGLTPAERDHPSNLIVLCPTHHGEVDGQHQRFPADTLLEWKAAQETKISRDLRRSITDVGYAELEVAARAVAAATAAPSPTDYTVIPPADKMERNQLGSKPALLLSMGAAKSHEVEQVLLKAAQLDPYMPARMTAGFVAHYEKQKALGLTGDDLFFEMYDWASGGSDDEVRRASGLCILSHLFILCDVFEK